MAETTPGKRPEYVMRAGDVRIAIFNHEGFRTAAVECKYTTERGGRGNTKSWNAANLIVLSKVAEWAANYIITMEGQDKREDC